MSLPLFIVNDFDRPSPKHITIRKEDGLLYYVHPELEKWKGMSVTTAVPLEIFGIECHEELGILHGVQARPSNATYRDTRPREWQGPERFSFVTNKHFAAYKAEALRAGGVI